MNLRTSYILVAVMFLGLGNLVMAGGVSGKVEVTGGDKKAVLADFKAELSKGSVNGFLRLTIAENDKASFIKIVNLKINGSYAWFSGKCTSSDSDKLGNWLFVAIHDGGTPGEIADHIWWQWLGSGDKAKSPAARKVENFEKPAENKIIKTGNITVK